MITPAEIQDRTFTRGVRGYKEDEVDKFLDLITLDVDKLLHEIKTLRERNEELTEEIAHYRETESALAGTLESAKALMTDISTSAEKRADIVLKNAELDADRIQREARESVERITDEAVAMERRWEQFKLRYKNLLQNELDRFENLSSDLIIDTAAQGAGFFTDSIMPVKGGTIKTAKE
ncbi:MAG: DivIVA domain-containing protein [Clostridiales Family XIII bacterium]|jgi:cell division initiation protein|nr:DivIVA domain-containing protein [Clostridiales Family XIII bacterium]